MTCEACPNPGHDFVIYGHTFHRCDEHEQELRRAIAAAESTGRPCVKCGARTEDVDGVAQLQCEYCASGRPRLAPDALQTLPSTRCTCGAPGAQRVVINGAAYMQPLCETCAEAAGADEAALMEYPVYRALAERRKDSES